MGLEFRRVIFRSRQDEIIYFDERVQELKTVKSTQKEYVGVLNYILESGDDFDYEMLDSIFEEKQPKLNKELDKYSKGKVVLDTSKDEVQTYWEGFVVSDFLLKIIDGLRQNRINYDHLDKFIQRCKLNLPGVLRI